MTDLDIYKSKGDEFCACCRKQGKGFTSVVVGVFRMPFCDDCYDVFKKMVAKGATKEVEGV